MSRVRRIHSILPLQSVVNSYKLLVDAAPCRMHLCIQAQTRARAHVCLCYSTRSRDLNRRKARDILIGQLDTLVNGKHSKAARKVHKQRKQKAKRAARARAKYGADAAVTDAASHGHITGPRSYHARLRRTTAHSSRQLSARRRAVAARLHRIVVLHQQRAWWSCARRRLWFSRRLPRSLCTW